MTEIQCTIDISDTSTVKPSTSSTGGLAHKWVIKVSNEVKNLRDISSKESERWKRQSVYRVPSSVKDLCSSSSNAYEPQTVSIGPYHHGKSRLNAMEEHKHRALLHFLERSGKSLQCYVDALAPEVEDLKDAYDQLDGDKWHHDTEAFLELMIVDGCFILELLRTTTSTTTTTADQKSADSKEQHAADINDPHVSASKHGKLISTSTDDQSPDSKEKHIMMGYADNDPVFSKHGKLYIVPYLKRDMLMLENQIPMLVLTTLLSTAENDVPTPDGRLSKEDEVIRLILELFKEARKGRNLGKCLHILDVYRKSLLVLPQIQETAAQKSRNKPTQKKSNRRGGDKLGPDDIIRSATELQEAGITIKKSRTRYLADISFHRGVLELPAIIVDDTFESGFLNLMAFERFHVGAGNEVTSYVFFMDNIIDSNRDVSLLHSCGIIQNALGSDKAVANLFNSLSKDITLDPDSRLDIVHKQVSGYCQKLLPRWKASLKHNYFTNPWVGLSVVAAIFLFALTGLQTLYTVLGYYNPNK